jgi:uncharacterized protein (DUF433 family)
MNTPRDRAAVADAPAYTGAEVARLLALPAATVRAWFFGMPNSTEREFERVLTPADPRRRLLSFVNLCEAHVLAIVRRSRRVPLPSVRMAMSHLAEKHQVEHPLLSRRLVTDTQGGLFVDDGDGRLLQMTRSGQYAMREVLEQALSRIDWSERDTPVRLFPVPAYAGSPDTAPRQVAIDPAIRFGRPILLGAGVTTEVISDRFRAGDTIDELASDFGVDCAAIEEAIRFQQRVEAGSEQRATA